MFAATWLRESTFSTVYFMKSNYRSSTFNENLTAKLRCVIRVKYTPDLKDLVQKVILKISITFYLMNNLVMLNTCWNNAILDTLG